MSSLLFARLVLSHLTAKFYMALQTLLYMHLRIESCSRANYSAPLHQWIPLTCRPLETCFRTPHSNKIEFFFREDNYAAVIAQSCLHLTKRELNPMWIVTHLGIFGEADVPAGFKFTPGALVRPGCIAVPNKYILADNNFWQVAYYVRSNNQRAWCNLWYQYQSRPANIHSSTRGYLISVLLSYQWGLDRMEFGHWMCGWIYKIAYNFCQWGRSSLEYFWLHSQLQSDDRGIHTSTPRPWMGRCHEHCLWQQSTVLPDTFWYSQISGPSRFKCKPPSSVF